MKKGFLSFFLFTAFALALCPSCKDDETAEWKNVAFSVASNLAPENGTIPYEGSTVVFTVTTDGKWTYAIDQSKTDWFTHPTVDGMTLAILIPENTVSRERSGVVRFISVSDPTLVEEFTITQEPGPVPPEAPKADLLDVVFHADGTAEDVSPLKNEVLSYPGTALTCYYHDVYKRIVTNYTHTPGQGSRKDSYYRVDYYTNETFKQGLDDGHTLEVVLRSNRNDGTKEYKPFSAHEAGGTGFLICKEGQGGHPACITFLPNVSTTGKSTWRWAQSDVTPEPGRYYHVVGVWDKTAEKAYIYVDGQLKGTADAPGELIHAKDGARWFALGGDSAVGSMGNAWNGEVVLARVFDDALTGDQIALLYQDAAFAGQTPVEFALSNLTYLTRCEIGAGYTYTVYGNGFAAGDKVKFTSSANVTAAFTADAAFTEASGDNTLQSLDPPRGDSRRNGPVFHGARPQRQPIPARHGRIHRLRQSLRLDAPDHRAPRPASGRRGEFDREFDRCPDQRPETGHPRRRVRRLDHRRRRAGDQPQRDGGRQRPADRRERLCTDQGPHAGQRRKIADA